MALLLDLDPDLTSLLQEEARRRGTTEAVLIEDLLRAQLAPRRSLADLLESWIVEDHTNEPAELERRERDLASFKEAMNAAHTSDRKLFP